MKTFFTIFSAALLLAACSLSPKVVTDATSEAVCIDSRFDAIQDTAYLSALVSIKEAKDSIMGVVIGYAPEALVRVAPESNLMNWSANALLDIAREVTGIDVDAAVVNLGGLRCDISQGNITVGHIYSLMPFDNKLVVVTMEGKDIIDLCNTFARRRGEAVAGIRMVINGDKAEDIMINGKPIVQEALYTIATSDYLSTGTDEMVAFTRSIDKVVTGQKIRDLYIDYVRKSGKMEAAVDGRMVRR